MPEIELPADTPLPGASTYSFPVLSYMLYPRLADAERRRSWLAAAMAGAYVWWREQEGVTGPLLWEFHGWIADLWRLKIAPKQTYENGLIRGRRASWSAQMLAYLLTLDRFHPRHVRVERAKILTHEISVKKGASVSESQLEKVWAEFKPVSHLWLAYRQLGRPGGAGNEEVIKRLAYAESLRLHAEDRRIFDPDEVWRAASDLPLDLPDIEIKPLASDEAQLLDAYYPD